MFRGLDRFWVPRFREPVPIGSKLWIGSHLPWVHEPVSMLRGLDRFRVAKIREPVPIGSKV